MPTWLTVSCCMPSQNDPAGRFLHVRSMTFCSKQCDMMITWLWQQDLLPICESRKVSDDQSINTLWIISSQDFVKFISILASSTECPPEILESKPMRMTSLLKKKSFALPCPMSKTITTVVARFHTFLIPWWKRSTKGYDIATHNGAIGQENYRSE